jgi:hypothetical protein
MQTEVGMTGVVWPNILLIHWIYCVGVASSIRKVALRLSLNGKKESNLNKKKKFVFSVVVAAVSLLSTMIFFFWNACLECNTSVCLSSYVYRVERKENDAHRRCHRLKYTGSAQQLFSLPPPLSLLLPLSFLFLLPFLLLCVVRLFLFWKATSTVAQRKTANTATISRMTRSFFAITSTAVCIYTRNYKALFFITFLQYYTASGSAVPQ